MKICVTGAAGFIGSWIVEALIHEGHRVLAMDDCSGGRRGNLVDHRRASFCHIDLRDADATIKEISEFKPEIIYHLAANAREGASFFQPISVVSRNVGAYTNVLTAGIRARTRRIVLFSSMAVYGNQPAPFREEMPKKPVDVYGLCKAQMEDMTQMLAGCHGFEWVIVRPHNVFGPRQALDDIHRNVLGIWMNKIMRGEPLTIYGNGSQVRAFSYIENSMICYLNAMDCASGQVFNIGGDVGYSIIDACRLVLEAMGESLSYPVEYLPDRHAEVKVAYSDHTLAREILGMNNLISFEDGLKHMAIWALEMGPQVWRNHDKLEIPNALTPKVW